jgi:hypothetical protein
LPFGVSVIFNKNHANMELGVDHDCGEKDLRAIDQR